MSLEIATCGYWKEPRPSLVVQELETAMISQDGISGQFTTGQGISGSVVSPSGISGSIKKDKKLTGVF